MRRGFAIALGAAAAVAFGAAAARADTPTPWVIAIGNNVGLGDEVPLRYAERDALELATVLKQHGDVPASNAVTLIGSSVPAVKAVLTLTAERVRVTSPDALVVVYYSGHADARGLHLNGEILSYGELERSVLAIPGKLRVMIIDACRSGAVTRVKGIKAAPEFEIAGDDRVAARGLAVITSSAAGEDSYESERLRASFFSHHLVTGLRGAADADGDGRVALDEVYRYTYAQTLRSSGTTRELQHPTFRFDVRGRGDVILTRLEDDSQVARLVLPSVGTYLVIEGTPGGAVVAEAAATRPDTKLLLAARRYFIQERHRSHYLEYDIRLKPGSEVSLSSFPSRRVDYARLVRKGGGRSPVHGLRLHGGARGGMLEGQQITPQIVLGYGLDLEALSLGVRVRWAPPTTLGETSADGLEREHGELGLSLTAQRFWDAPGISLGLGLIVEASWLHQSFEDTSGTLAEPSSRNAVAGAFGLLASVQVPLGAGLQLELEGGPQALIYQATTLSQGAPRGDETRTAVTWFATGGLAWTF